MGKTGLPMGRGRFAHSPLGDCAPRLLFPCKVEAFRHALFLAVATLIDFVGTTQTPQAPDSLPDRRS